MSGAILAQLMAQGVGQGADLATLRAIVEEAGELGASRALTRLGLDDRHAAKDMAELRQLLEAWRDAKKSAWRAVVGWVVRIGGAVLIAGIAVRMGFGGLVK
ncbi:MAG: hypothetical protein K2P68_05870 [Sphingomonas sp.]|nr:hypothetical protein [Sphingomonas sp.]